MKIFSWLAAILIIAVVIAALTVPGDKKFTDFINRNKGGDTMTCKPVIGKNTAAKAFSVKLFSFHSVSYCEASPETDIRPFIRRKTTVSVDSSQTASAKKFPLLKITLTENYLGLFGKFWKL